MKTNKQNSEVGSQKPEAQRAELYRMESQGGLPPKPAGQTCPYCGCSGQAPDSLKCDDCGADLKPQQAAETTRNLDSISLFWPLTYGDTIELDGPAGGDLWRVDRSSSGWYLHKIGGAASENRHPKIHSLDGMADFIHAILEWAKGYC